MTFKIIDVKTKRVLHEVQVEPNTIHNLVTDWGTDRGTQVDSFDPNTPGTADIDASLTGFNFSATFSYFYL